MAYDGSLKFDTKVDSSGFKTGIDKLAGIAKTGLKAATAAIGAVSAAIVAAGGYAIKAGSDFEAGMSQVAAISGATGKDLEELTDKAKEMGAKTKFSATEASEAFQYMAMAGWKTGDMLNGIEGIMNLAAASGEELGSVSDIVTDALTAFGLQAKDSAHFADVLAKASSNSNTNVGLMGATFKYVAPIAGSMKYSIEDTAVAIGLMANAGIKGEQAGTALRAMLTRLVKPPKDASIAMDKLGISTTNADGSMKPLSTTLKELREKFSKLSDSEKASYAASIAGTEAMSGMLAIVNASDKDFDSLTKSINNADGAAQDMADTMQDNLQGDITILKSSVEGLGIAVYDSMQEPLRSAAQTGIEYINQITAAFKHGGLKEAVSEAGDIFASLAVKAAEKAPDMINAAVDFIQSFIKGIKKNAPQLLQAAQDIVWALVDGLVKLMPKEIQEPVRETVDGIKKSFTDGGLRDAINTVGNILKNLGKVCTNVAKVVLPPFSKAVDFLGKNLKIILPLVTGAVVAWKTWSIVQRVKGWMTASTAAIAAATAATAAETAVTGASTAALTLKELAVGVLTGKVSLATAAQWLWNAAMSANPIGAVITLVATLVAGIALLCAGLGDGKSAEEKLADANKVLGDSFGNVGESAADFYDGIQSAESHLSDFNDTLFASSEEQQKLQQNMEEVQNGITTICKTASDERRDYTDQEIKQLDSYFEKLREINDRELEIQASKMEAIKKQAVQQAEIHSGSLEEYQTYAQEWIKTAEEQATQQKSLIDEQTTNELVLLDQRYGDQATLSNTAYKKEYDELMARKKEKVDAVNQEVSEVVSAYEEGYVKRSDATKKYVDHVQDVSLEEEYEKKRHNDRLKELNDEIAELDAKGMKKTRDDYYSLAALEREREGENKAHTQELAKIRQKYNDGFDEDVQEELGTWLTLLTQTEQYGGKITDKNRKMVGSILDIMDTLPEETRDSMKNAMSPMLDEMKKAEPSLWSKASNIANGILDRLKKAFDIHSPSKKTRAIFRNVMAGAEGGMDDEKPRLYKQTSGIAEGVLDRFQKAKLDASSLVQKMRAAIAAETSRLSSSVSVSAEYDAARNIPQPQQPDVTAPGGNYVADVHVNLDGREVARATAPFMGSQLAWEG